MSTDRLSELLNLADFADGCVLAVTHVRNLLAATTIIEGGDRTKVPVKGGPSTGTISIVEKIEGRWRILREDGREIVEQTKFSSEDAAIVQTAPPQLVSVGTSP